MIDTAAGGKREVLAPGGVGAAEARLSPDDRWLSYDANQSGRSEVYVQPFSRAGAAVRVSTRGGETPRWSPTGRELFFRRNDELVSVSYRDENGQFAVGEEKTLFSLPRAGARTFRLNDVARDGRFLIARLVDPEPSPGIRVVLNWLQELRPTATSRPAAAR